MHFEKGNIYRIYIQGNNRREIFFKQENYLFFLRKIKTHILTYADVFAWCLIPNHFHLMVYVNQVELEISRESASETLAKAESKSETLAETGKKRTFNQSIGIMLRSML